MGVIAIKNRTYATYSSRFKARELKDFPDTTLMPQKAVMGKALTIGVSFAFANSDDRLFIIHISMSDSGMYYFGYAIHLDDGYMGAHPSVSKGNSDKCASESFVKCILNALNYCRNRSIYYNTPPDRRLVQAVEHAIHEVNSYRLRQMSIFDML